VVRHQASAAWRRGDNKQHRDGSETAAKQDVMDSGGFRLPDKRACRGSFYALLIIIFYNTTYLLTAWTGLDDA